MDKKLKDKWIKALRSGEYAQGREVLAQPSKNGEFDKFCCLGVLACVMGAEWEEVEGVLGFGPNKRLVPNIKGHPNKAHDAIVKTQILPESIIPEGDQRALAGLNDNSKWGFKKIATWIENNL